MQKRVLLSIVAVILVAIASGPAVALSDVTAETRMDSGADMESLSLQSTDCTTEVLHDSFLRNNSTIERVANGSTGRSVRDNTLVTLKKTDGFYKLHAENPNAYCVRFEVLVSSRAMRPATFPGGVLSNDGNTTANWSSTYNFATDRRYTKISFTLDPSEKATFAPNRPAVATMSLATRSSDRAEGALGNLTNIFGEDNSTQIKRTYYVDAPNNTSTVRIRMQHPETGEPITSYHTVWSYDNKTWKKVSSATEEPVYKRMSSDGKYLILHFSEQARNKSAVVRFTANPGLVEDTRYQWQTWSSGWDLIGGIFGGGDS